jgi:FtsZ-interacting cell division protein ZipA
MLPYALAIAVGLSSSILFLTAFFFRDIHRQDDFFWSGVGLFYALVLWFCATSVTGAILLGQLAIVALLTAYFWQMFKLRKAIANPEKKESLDSFSVVGFLQNLFKRSASSSIPKINAETDTKTKIATNNEKIDKTKTDSTPPTIVTSKTANQTPNNTSNTNTKPSVEVTTPPTRLNEILDVEPETTIETNLESANNSVTTPPSAAEVIPPNNETTESEIKEITVETVRIVEEESNWNDEDDEVDEIPASSIKAIEEVPPKDEKEMKKEE